MNKDLKLRLLSNAFTIKLSGEMVLDEEDYADLCQALRDLADEWRDQTLIDKEVMQRIYGLDKDVLVVVHLFGDRKPALTERLEEIAIELEGLILECLSTNTSLEHMKYRLGLWGIQG